MIALNETEIETSKPNLQDGFIGAQLFLKLTSLKGTVSRNSSKFKQWELPGNCVKHIIVQYIKERHQYHSKFKEGTDG